MTRQRNTFNDEFAFKGIDLASGPDTTYAGTVPENSKIKTIQFNGNFNDVEKFCGGDAEYRDGKLIVATHKGPLTVSPNDWIIRTSSGNFFTLSSEEWFGKEEL